MLLAFLVCVCVIMTSTAALGLKLGVYRMATRRRSMILMSYGDPDMGQKWKRLRWVQETARSLDEAVYPHDSDVPGLTFLSPVEWAPWMETIWFGNQYDYRSAYFHDVMYSNNKPCREGALLFSDRDKAQDSAAPGAGQCVPGGHSKHDVSQPADGAK